MLSSALQEKKFKLLVFIDLLMTDFICHFFAAINIFSVSDFHYH